MFKNNNIFKLPILLVFLCCSSFVFSQKGKQQELEMRRQELRAEIQKINELRTENKSKEKSQLSLIEDFNYKISVLNNLIKVTNQQANFLTREINSNQKKITNLRDDLKQFKDDYAAMIVKSYKSKNQQSRIMFLLSSNNFKQAYKRLQYIKQYSDHQKQQGVIIKTKTEELQNINANLLTQKKDKQKLISENRKTQKSLEVVRKQHETLMKSIKKNINFYTAQIRKKQKESDKIDKAIAKIIREAIANSNKKSGKRTTTKSIGFALTPAGKALAKDFESNKGKLGWPLKRGIVKVRYGTQPHPINKSLTIKSNGVRIATEKSAKVYAIFNGEVMAIQVPKRGTPSVYIKHGNYVSVYKNITKISVKKGDKISKNQVLGEVITSASSRETILNFSIFKDAKTVNPANWIYKM